MSAPAPTTRRATASWNAGTARSRVRRSVTRLHATSRMLAASSATSSPTTTRCGSTASSAMSRRTTSLRDETPRSSTAVTASSSPLARSGLARSHVLQSSRSHTRCSCDVDVRGTMCLDLDGGRDPSGMQPRPVPLRLAPAIPVHADQDTPFPRVPRHRSSYLGCALAGRVAGCCAQVFETMAGIGFPPARPSPNQPPV